eukprot:3132058-Rhodomonas_salina.3
MAVPVLLGGTEDGLAFMWDISHDRGVGGGEEYYGRCLQVFAGHPDMVTCGGFADMGRLVVTGGQVPDPRLSHSEISTEMGVWRYPGRLSADFLAQDWENAALAA